MEGTVVLTLWLRSWCVVVEVAVCCRDVVVEVAV